MNPAQIAAFIEFFKSNWTQAERWGESTWEHWSRVLIGHGPRYVRLALHSLIHDPAFREFPPGLAAFCQALDEAEAYELDRMAGVKRRLAESIAEGDEEQARRAEEALARWRARLMR